ncbi:MAG TPA: DinB family protein [Tepidisphaeraceae bacterium]|jgi:hypothetical protein
MDKQTLLLQIDYTRNRLIGSLGAIESSGADVADALAWRPGPGRAHIAWQAMHCAATLDKYVNVGLLKGQPADADLVAHYGGGSTPSDTDVPDLMRIRGVLEHQFAAYRKFVEALSPDDLTTIVDFNNTTKRSIGESILLLTWHEAHHQGQIHLTWNLYKAARGL